MASRLLREMPIAAKSSLSSPFSLPWLEMSESGSGSEVSLPLGGVVADDEVGAVEDEDGLGHVLLYTYCSGAPSQSAASPASYSPSAKIQQLPEAYGELLSLFGLN